MSDQQARYSFDIFDTLLTRTVFCPIDVFRFVQNRIKGQEDVPGPLQTRFVSARIWAEFKARRLVPEEDVSLENVYDVMAKDFVLPSEVSARMLKTELKVESLCIVPIEAVVERVHQLHSLGEKIIFASSKSILATFLNKTRPH